MRKKPNPEFVFRSNYNNRSKNAIRWVVDSTNGELGYRAVKISHNSKRIILKNDFSVFRITDKGRTDDVYEKFLNQLDFGANTNYCFNFKK